MAREHKRQARSIFLLQIHNNYGFIHNYCDWRYRATGSRPRFSDYFRRAELAGNRGIMGETSSALHQATFPSVAKMG